MKKEVKLSRLRGRPPKTLGQDGQALIVDAALDLFSAQGYSGTSLKMIGERVGFKPNALYAHFESKDALKNHILKEYALPAVTMELERSELLALLSEPEQTLKSLFDRLVSQWLSPKGLRAFKFLLRENLGAEVDPALQINEMSKQLRERFLLLIKSYIQFEKIRPLDPEWLCAQFFAPIIAIRMEVALSSNQPQLKQVQQKVHRHIELFFEVFGN
jgi:AcrR family transcriptional regulator